ncbi:hypothetical protein P43SY_002360 [Pythium insidiosum]|uniref:Peptidase A1 domain-containing protein n=1 Tax=Pythium insidiosum TaxID=114742 RepID=A0AAD5LSZ8_PYTIN|nr:hypothetical protein P43SY_002360 [Pythium insidiosum]
MSSVGLVDITPSLLAPLRIELTYGAIANTSGYFFLGNVDGTTTPLVIDTTKDGIWTQCDEPNDEVKLQVGEIDLGHVAVHQNAPGGSSASVFGLGPLSSSLFSTYPKISISLDESKPFLALGDVDSGSMVSKTPLTLAAFGNDAWQVGLSAIQVEGRPPITLPTQTVQLDVRHEASCLPVDIFRTFQQSVLAASPDCKVSDGRITCASTANLPRLALDLDGKTFFMNAAQYTKANHDKTQYSVQLEVCRPSAPWRLGSSFLRSFVMVLEKSSPAVTLFCDVGKTCLASGIPLHDYTATHRIALRTGSRQLRRSGGGFFVFITTSEEGIVLSIVILAICLGCTFMRMVDCDDDKSETNETQPPTAVPVTAHAVQPVVMSPYHAQAAPAVEKPYWELRDAPPTASNALPK